ncbi:hypothetical protein [Spongiivirga citrea]|uniref:Uncharacterized protein n=1 Tax=Spongiivirga citrea TaxID=1481457 RepID=A0A6M0CGH3_9FLAO|nr:hypothetical protein [Spongiivirga citrea]NER16013.1 hypothetical protein [Spongiivirga citrea]
MFNSRTYQYYKFLLRSTNKHGVHSPFVYDLITKCFKWDCNRGRIYRTTEVQMLRSLASYFNVQTIATDGDLKRMPILIEKDYKWGDLDSISNETDFIIIFKPKNMRALVEEVLPSLKNDVCIALVDVYRKRKSIRAWKTHQKNEDITASIDFYKISLLFKRKEQQKQHFVIRL